MPIATPQQYAAMLDAAQQGDYAYPAVNVTSITTINAALNGLATLLLLLGYIFIRRENTTAHKRCMIGAFATSAVFLAGYLWYHFNSDFHTSLKHPTAAVNYLYYFILITHIFLAAAIVPLVLMTVIPALRARFDRHRKWARITLPLWLYVSITGVIVYLMLYVWFPSAMLAA